MEPILCTTLESPVGLLRVARSAEGLVAIQFGAAERPVPPHWQEVEGPEDEAGEPAMADEQYVWLDGTWRTLKVNQRIAAITQRSRAAIARSQAELPQLVAQHRTRDFWAQQRDWD